MRVASVNVATPQPLAGRRKPTGIFKQAQPGPVPIGPLGLEGDAIMDRKHHGGPDQAVYIYLQADYDWWMEELGNTLEPGTFGENLTIGGLAGETLAVGDRFRIGAVELEVTLHRAPCATLAARMGDPGYVRRFQRARRPGAECSVLRPGEVEAGMPVTYSPFGGPPLRLVELVDADSLREPDPAFMRRALATPIHHKLRADYEARLANPVSPR